MGKRITKVLGTVANSLGTRKREVVNLSLAHLEIISGGTGVGRLGGYYGGY